jgi:hypothetical protein
MVAQMQTIKYKHHEIARPTGETYTTPTIEVAAFLAERLIDMDALLAVVSPPEHE